MSCVKAWGHHISRIDCVYSYVVQPPRAVVRTEFKEPIIVGSDKHLEIESSRASDMQMLSPFLCEAKVRDLAPQAAINAAKFTPQVNRR